MYLQLDTEFWKLEVTMMKQLMFKSSLIHSICTNIVSLKSI